MTAITGKKLQGKLMKEKILKMKKTVEMIKQNTYEKKNNKNTIPEALISNRKLKLKKNQYGEIWTNMDKFNTPPRNIVNNNRPCIFCDIPNWNPAHKCPALDQTCNNWASFHGHADRKKITNAKYGM